VPAEVPAEAPAEVPAEVPGPPAARTTGLRPSTAYWPPLNDSRQKNDGLARERIIGDSDKIKKWATAKAEDSKAEAKKSSKLLTPLFKFDKENRAQSLERWERVDDIIMGGISSSGFLVESDKEDSVAFRGIVREEGGGFCGQRSKLMSEPLDLSKWEGVYLSCRGPDDDGVDRRNWKMSLRTKQDRGEVIYSTLLPRLPRGADNGGKPGVVLVPFSSFQLVRGPRLVVGAAPIDPSAVYQISMTCTKFEIAENTTTLETFLPGPFRLDIAALGVYATPGEQTASNGAAPTVTMLPPPEEPGTREKARPLPLKVLAPLASFVFSEKARRRGLALTKLTKAREVGGLGYSRSKALALGWALKQRRFAVSSGSSSGSPASAAAKLQALSVLLGEAGGDALRFALTLPLRLGFKAAFALVKLKKNLGAASGASGAPKLPSLG